MWGQPREGSTPFTRTIGSSRGLAGIQRGPFLATLAFGHEDDGRSKNDEGEAQSVRPCQSLLPVQRGEAREHDERDDLLNRLEFGRRVRGRADPVGRNGQRVLEECDSRSSPVPYPQMLIRYGRRGDTVQNLASMSSGST